MARIRTIKPEFWQDEKLAPLPIIDRFVFLGLISAADDYGRVLDNERVLNAFIFPETDDSVRESLANLSRIGRILRGKTASGQKVIQIVNWERHQKVDKPQPKMAYPEIVEYQEVTPIREPFANHSRTIRDALAPHTTDLHTTDLHTTDLIAGTACAAPEPQLALIASTAKPRKAPKAPRPLKWPEWTEDARRAAYEHWRSNFGGIEYGRFIAGAGPTLGEGLPNYDRLAVWTAWRQCVGIASIASPSSRFLADPAKIGAHVAEACRILATEPNVGEQSKRLQVLLHGKEIA